MAARQKEPPLSVAELFNETAPPSLEKPEVVVPNGGTSDEDANADVVGGAPLFGASPQRSSLEQAKDKSARPSKRPPPFSMRFTDEERARLDRDAAGMSLAAHIRERLFGDDVKPRRTRGRFPVKDQAALARVLSALGSSDLFNGLSRLLLAVEEGRCPLDADLEQELRNACSHAERMRIDLVAALGLKPE